MTINYAAHRAANDFSCWAVATPTSDFHPYATSPQKAPTCLAGFLYHWLESGHGVRACHGDFATFLAAIPIIIQEWLKDGPHLNYVEYLDPDTIGEDDDDAIIHERPVTTVFPESREDGAWLILDRSFFDRCVFSELHGRYVAPS